jgi:hypothetical protein
MGWMTEGSVFGFLLSTSGERAPGPHWIGDWVGPRASLNAVEDRIPLFQSSLLIMYLILIGLEFIYLFNFGFPLLFVIIFYTRMQCIIY